MTILVSACLLGVPCRYDGQSKAHPLARALCEKHHVVPVCGEIFGGLPTPRPPAEIQGDRVVTRDGRDVTEAYRRGAEAAAQLARLTGAQAAVLKERSPSCGSGAVYDGTFSGTLTEGWGVTAALLRQQGLRVVGESGRQFDQFGEAGGGADPVLAFFHLNQVAFADCVAEQRRLPVDRQLAGLSVRAGNEFSFAIDIQGDAHAGTTAQAARVNAGCQQGVAYCQAAQVEQAQGLSVQRNVEEVQCFRAGDL